MNLDVSIHHDEVTDSYDVKYAVFLSFTTCLFRGIPGKCLRLGSDLILYFIKVSTLVSNA